MTILSPDPYIPVFRAWMAERGIASEIVRYEPRNFKHWPPYAGIAENMLTNATLPSVVFNGGSCSQKWKAAPQDAWTARWEPARRCWDAFTSPANPVAVTLRDAGQHERLDQLLLSPR